MTQGECRYAAGGLFASLAGRLSPPLLPFSDRYLRNSATKS